MSDISNLVPIIRQLGRKGPRDWRLWVDRAFRVAEGDTSPLDNCKSQKDRIYLKQLSEDIQQRCEGLIQTMSSSDGMAFFFNGNFESREHRRVAVLSYDYVGNIPHVGQAMPLDSPAGKAVDVLCVAVAENRKEVLEGLRATLYNLGG